MPLIGGATPHSSPRTELDGRVFATYTRGYAEGVITVRATSDDVSWALMHLGQYVDGRRGIRMFRAYVQSVEAHATEGSLITVLVEPL